MNTVHELVEKFTDAGLSLNQTLEDMLNEDPAHQTERRGCGYTQATRHLAAQINLPRKLTSCEDLQLFKHWGDKQAIKRIETVLNTGDIVNWRGWDLRPPEPNPSQSSGGLDRPLIEAEAYRQKKLRHMPNVVQREESKLLAQLISDIVLPVDAKQTGHVILPAWPEKLAVGSCPMAEQWFLEIAHGFVSRKGRCNFIVDENERPILLEKMNMGDNHSCFSLQTCVINGVRIPPGSLIAARYDEQSIIGEPLRHQHFRGCRIPLGLCEGFRLLRLTTLAVSPRNRHRAFTVHFEAQRAAGLFEPGSTKLEQLQHLAEQACALPQYS